MADNFQNDQNVQQAVTNALAEQKKKKKKKRLIIVAVIIAIIIIIGIVAGGSGDDESSSNSSPSNSTSDTIKVDGDEEKKQNDADGTIGSYICTVKSAKLCKNYDGKDAVKITYNFTNNSSEAASFDIALTDEVYQDGVGLETGIFTDEEQDTFDVKIKPGTTKEVSKIYVLRDKETPLDIEISEWISFGDKKLTYTVELQ